MEMMGEVSSRVSLFESELCSNGQLGRNSASAQNLLVRSLVFLFSPYILMDSQRGPRSKVYPALGTELARL